MDKEGFVIVSTLKWLPYLLWGGVAIHGDHRNLAYFFGANGAPTSKPVAQRLQGWRVFLGQFPYTIVHTPGDENCWKDLLSRWVTRPGGPVCVNASVKYAEVFFAGSDKFPTKEVVRGVQAAAAGDGPTLDTALGVASLESEGLYRVEYHGHRVILVPAGAKSLKKRLLVCAHLEGVGHRGVDATMARLERHCVREGLAGDVRDMTRLCLYCADTKAGALVPRTLEETSHGREPNAVVHFDFLYMGKSAVDVGVDAADGFQYVLLILEDVSGYKWLRPSRACTANGIVEELVGWFATFRPPTTWVSDNATHFRNRVVRNLAKSLGVEHRFSVANSAWTNGTVERMMREVIHGAKAMLNEWGRPLSEWVVVLPAVQWALNSAWRKRLQTTPYHVMMEREPRTAFTALIEGDDEGFQISPIDENRLQQLVVSPVDT